METDILRLVKEAREWGELRERSRIVAALVAIIGKERAADKHSMSLDDLSALTLDIAAGSTMLSVRAPRQEIPDGQ
jgi:hypothetical protein